MPTTKKKGSRPTKRQSIIDTITPGSVPLFSINDLVIIKGPDEPAPAYYNYKSNQPPKQAPTEIPLF